MRCQQRAAAVRNEIRIVERARAFTPLLHATIYHYDIDHSSTFSLSIIDEIDDFTIIMLLLVAHVYVCCWRFTPRRACHYATYEEACGSWLCARGSYYAIRHMRALLERYAMLLRHIAAPHAALTPSMRATLAILSRRDRRRKRTWLRAATDEAMRVLRVRAYQMR